jgi:predicted nuclease with TOPRIM domain
VRAFAKHHKGEDQMREQIQIRLEELKKEFEIGQSRLQETDRQQALLRETLLRISGAIQVLEETLASSKDRQEGLSATDSGQESGPAPAVRKSAA